MFLAIDVGNTTIVFGVFDGAELIDRQSISRQDFILHNEIPLGLSDVVNAIWVSSVVPEVDEGIRQVCQDKWGIDPVFVSTQNAGIHVDVERPGQVGADRLVNAVAVQALYQKPAIVVDFGTATTFDVVDESGAYCGGVIAPGVNLSIKALEEAAAQLPDIIVEKPSQAIGKDTRQAMQSGVYYGYLGLVERIVREISDEMEAQPFVLATGGLASFFAEECSVIDAVDGDLTLKGLQIIGTRCA